MTVTAIYGMHWGDEGKGKIIDLIAPEYKIVVRFAGGDNAGHTVVNELGETALHLIPSGIFTNALCVLGNGMVINPYSLNNEMNKLKNKGVDFSDRLYVSERAHLILPYYIDIEEQLDKKLGVGTTKKGIGIAYMFKAQRTGIRVCDVEDPDTFRKRVKIHSDQYNLDLNPDEVLDNTAQVLGEIKKDTKVIDTVPFFRDYSSADILVEGAQGLLLGIDSGTFPYVTSSDPSPNYANAGCLGLPAIDKTVGIMKGPYVTRVGHGPFPTELGTEKDLEGVKKGEEELTEKDIELMSSGDSTATGKYLRITGWEYGATTGRPRRCGFLDLVASKYSKAVARPDAIVLTKMDVGDELPEIPICTAYGLDGNVVTDFPAKISDLERCVPIYDKRIQGWLEPTRGMTDYDKLPGSTRELIRFLGNELAPVEMISTGRERNKYIDMGLL